MRAFPTKQLRRGGVALAALVLAASPALAQLGPPVRLLPQQSPPDPSAQSGTSRPSATPTAPGLPMAPPGRVPSGNPAQLSPPDQDDIQAVPLAPVDAAWAGTLGENDGGLPRAMWRGTPRAFIAAALPLLAPSASPTLQLLARRLLLSDADAPAGTDAPDQPSLPALRLDRLLALGDVADALPLLDKLPSSAASDAVQDGMERNRIELRFAANDVDGACAAVARGVARFPGTWWDRALIACQALSGDSAKAGLGLSLLAEQKAPPDPGFTALVETLDGLPRKLDKLPDPTPLKLALLAATKQPLPADALATAGPAALYGYATNEKLPPELRLAAAERATLLGALSPDALGVLYQKIAAKPDEASAAAKDGKLPADPRSRALAFQVARSTSPAPARAAALAALLAEARKRGAFAATARMVTPFLAEIPADGQPPSFAADAARAFLAVGQIDAALPWIAAAGSRELLLLSRIAGPQADAPAPLLHDAIAGLDERDKAAAPAQAALLAALLDGLGDKPDASDWSPPLLPAHQAILPDAALWNRAGDAATARRVGETVLATILIAEAGDRLSTEPIVLGRAIAGLRAIGLDADARALAVEAALAAGI